MSSIHGIKHIIIMENKENVFHTNVETLLIDTLKSHYFSVLCTLNNKSDCSFLFLLCIRVIHFGSLRCEFQSLALAMNA